MDLRELRVVWVADRFLVSRRGEPYDEIARRAWSRAPALPMTRELATTIGAPLVTAEASRVPRCGRREVSDTVATGYMILVRAPVFHGDSATVLVMETCVNARSHDEPYARLFEHDVRYVFRREGGAWRAVARISERIT